MSKASAAESYPRYSSLLAFLPYSEESDAVEHAMSEWLSNPTNMAYFKKGRRMATVTFIMEGEDERGHRVRMQSNGPLQLAGTLKT